MAVIGERGVGVADAALKHLGCLVPELGFVYGGRPVAVDSPVYGWAAGRKVCKAGAASATA